jgi:predicted PolB exonuclease-like 3'-5' exonuclease
MRPIVLDISTAPLPNASDYLDEPDEPEVPGNYKKLESIVDWIANEKPKLMATAKQKQLDRAGLDADLCRITGLGWWHAKAGEFVRVELAKEEATERDLLVMVTEMLVAAQPMLIGFNSAAFDWPILMRRAKYLGVPMPEINCDRFRTPHHDLYLKLSNHGAWKAHSLGFYVKRLGWTDLKKSLSGEEESRVPETGKWEELAESLRHDAEATRRLAVWLGLLK